MFKLVLLDKILRHVVNTMVWFDSSDDCRIARHRCGRISRLGVKRGRDHVGRKERRREIQLFCRRSVVRCTIVCYRFCHPARARWCITKEIRPSQVEEDERKGEANRVVYITRAFDLFCFTQSFWFFLSLSFFYILLNQLCINLSCLIHFFSRVSMVITVAKDTQKLYADRSLHRKHIEALHFHVRLYMYIYIQFPTHVISPMSFHAD